MTLAYQESATLMRDSVFIDRIKVACLHFAAYIYSEDPATAGHTSRLRWSGNTMAAPDVAASTIAPTVTMDANVQEQGAAIPDAELQTAVEAAVSKLL
jgi:hypothetical protein